MLNLANSTKDKPLVIVDFIGFLVKDCYQQEKIFD